MTMCAGHHPGGARLAGRLGQQRQWRGRPEPHRVDTVLVDQPTHPVFDRRDGQHQGPWVAHDLVIGCGVETLAIPPGRRVHSDVVSGGNPHPLDEVAKVGLDAAAAGRKIVSHQQDPAHLRRLTARATRTRTASLL